MIRVSFWAAVFLVLLRVCIGWHFFYEGFTKVRGAYSARTTGDEKVFSSEAFFRESESPAGRFARKFIGDLDEQLLARLTLPAVEGDKSKVPAKDRMPVALAKEWDAYFERFAKQYQLNDEDRQTATTKLDQAKADFVAWLDVDPAVFRALVAEEKALKEKGQKLAATRPTGITVKRTAPGANASANFDEEITVLQRCDELRRKIRDIKEFSDSKNPLMGKEVGRATLRAMKSEATAIRKQLQEELDGQNTKMKNAVASTLANRLRTYTAKLDGKTEYATLTAYLLPMKDGANPLSAMWTSHAEFIKEFGTKVSEAEKTEIDTVVRIAKERYDAWLAGKNEYGGDASPTGIVVSKWQEEHAQLSKKVADRTAAAKEGSDSATLKKLADEAVAELKYHEAMLGNEVKSRADTFRTQVDSYVAEPISKGYALNPDDRYFDRIPKNPIGMIDWSTRWFLAVVGALLLVGLFTRLSCFSAAIFLLLTVLVQPALPWYPTPPNAEGNYLLISKNVVEMVALIALMFTASGKWAGIDGLLYVLFGRRDETK